ncbi:glycogen biosynthesis protein GlgD [Bacillus fonticola]|uniref:glycogen biosynthesis protein GlgD n=1 Tax=Bacillus fonticola TaxID=2728853 RepID=UPI0014749807|nr:glycogen biosynthesis protein GlgD [Bacillus fonticola]
MSGKHRQKQNPEQKTRNGINNLDTELAKEHDQVIKSKKKYEAMHGQPKKSKD